LAPQAGLLTPAPNTRQGILDISAFICVHHRQEILFRSQSPRATMTKKERDRLLVVIRATEYLFLENIALKLVLEHRGIPHWQKLVEKLIADKEILAGVHLKFRDVYDQLSGANDPSEALSTLLAELPTSKKVQ
jgi:hypothetical protein